MRLTLKFTFALLVTMLCVMGAFAYAETRREISNFEAERLGDHLVLGRALASITGMAPEADQEAQLARASANLRTTQVRLVALRPVARRGLEPGIDRGSLVGVGAGDEMSATIERGDSRWLFTYVPIAGTDLAIECSEDLVHERDLVAGAVRADLYFAAALALASIIASTLLGVGLVGRPIGGLIELARKVGQGDLTTRLAPRQKDELATLALEMNQMCDALVSARDTAERESIARTEAYDQLRHGERLMTVGKLASGMAHELGTPMNVVGMRAKMIAGGELEGADARSSAVVIGEQVDRMSKIMRQLLDFARQRGPQKSRVALAPLITKAVSMVEPVAKAAGVNLEVEASEVTTEVDPTQVEQVVTNLIVNAVHASKPSSNVKVTLEERDATPPADHGGKAGKWLTLAISDQGSGIDEKNLERIFEPFFTTKEVGQGTGLGLSVVYGIVREHGGWIDVASTVGTGTTFTVYLPVQ